ncbi:MAG TPA: hypothetical protein VH325_02595 [Bryobacteraceae bacterium]|nr:hypothetical protein [Bryobacteraceae bacterium]
MIDGARSVPKCGVTGCIAKSDIENNNPSPPSEISRLRARAHLKVWLAESRKKEEFHFSYGVDVIVMIGPRHDPPSGTLRDDRSCPVYHIAEASGTTVREADWMWWVYATTFVFFDVLYSLIEVHFYVTASAVSDDSELTDYIRSLVVHGIYGWHWRGSYILKRVPHRPEIRASSAISIRRWLRRRMRHLVSGQFVWDVSEPISVSAEADVSFMSN